MKRAPIIIHKGPMCADKSLSLITDYQRAKAVGEFCKCYVPHDHKDGEFISSRLMGDNSEVRVPATKVEQSKQILDDVVSHLQQSYEFCNQNGLVVSRLRINIYIDEMQLLDDGIVSVIENQAHYGARTVGGLLDLDYRGEGFPLKGEQNMKATDIIGIASEVYQHFARCSYIMEDGAPCGRNASRTQRFRDIGHLEPSHHTDPTREIDPRKYIPVCEEHHQVPGKYKEVHATDDSNKGQVINGTERFLAK